MVKQLSRRTFLRGAGVTMALPFLDAMLPSRAFAAQPPGLPTRFLTYYVPNGIHMPAWTPTTDGANYELQPIMASLAPHKDDLLILSGVGNQAAIASVPGDHARGTGSFLSSMPVFKSEGANIKNGISVDQRIAQSIGEETLFPSLELGVEGGSSTGDCDSGYSCAYSRNISWSGPSTPLPKEINPLEAFDRLFKGIDSEFTSEQVAIRRKLRKSVLDFVLEDAKLLKQKLGTNDILKLNEYMESVYALETKINKEAEANQCFPGPKPANPADFQAQVKLMCDIMVLAFQCDMTRVATFMQGNAGSGRVFSFLGVGEGHHYLSHHAGDAVKQGKLQKINTWEVEQLAYLLAKMKSVPEGEGNLLDNSLVFFSSEIADGNSHKHKKLPMILAGKGRGAVTPGRHINYSGDPSVANLYVSILNAMSVPDSSFGMDSTGPLPQLKL
ncbi:MAG TPA: DUF1552 domain-containing protein [Myxococcales bacterium]|nr:DUF1552 domain-containing protein [Myxococcales bacterium]